MCGAVIGEDTQVATFGHTEVDARDLETRDRRITGMRVDCFVQHPARSRPENVCPRITKHDPPFSSAFPYLLDPHPAGPPRPPTGNPLQALLVLLVVALILWLDRCRRKSYAAEKPWVRKRSW